MILNRRPVGLGRRRDCDCSRGQGEGGDKGFLEHDVLLGLHRNRTGCVDMEKTILGLSRI